MTEILSQEDKEYSRTEVLKYEYLYSVRPSRYLAVVNRNCEILYNIDLGNCSQEDIFELHYYMPYTFIESNARVLFGKGVDLGKPIHMAFERDKEDYITKLLKEWTVSRNKDRTLDKVEGSKPKAESKYKRVNKATLIECKALRDSGKSWDVILQTMRDYDPKLLKSRGIQFIAKHNQ
jgi:hypothetical protein